MSYVLFALFLLAALLITILHANYTAKKAINEARKQSTDLLKTIEEYRKIKGE